MIRSLLIIVFLIVFTVPVSADIAVFTNGRIIKIIDFVLSEKEVTLKLDGGEITVDRTNVYRILQDEIEPLPEIKPKEYDKPSSFDGIISRLGMEHGIDSSLIKAIIQVESAFNPNAVSVDDARGLMQLLPSTAADYGITNLFDPESNLTAGVLHLKWLFGQLGKDDLGKVLAAYNAGLNAVKRYGGIPPYSETKNYVSKILSIYGNE